MRPTRPKVCSRRYFAVAAGISKGPLCHPERTSGLGTKRQILTTSEIRRAQSNAAITSSLSHDQAGWSRFTGRGVGSSLQRSARSKI